MHMHGLPKDVDLSLFIRREVIQVCIGCHQAQLNFDGRVRVSIEGEAAHRNPSNVTSTYSELRQMAEMLVGLLGKCVVEATRLEPGTLVLSFDSGDVIEIYDSSEHYESYQIIHGDKWIVV